MKSVILAAVAMFVCVPAFAADAAAAAPKAEVTVECKTKLDACKDQGCKDALAAEGCKAEEATEAAK